MQLSNQRFLSALVIVASLAYLTSGCSQQEPDQQQSGAEASPEAASRNTTPSTPKSSVPVTGKSSVSVSTDGDATPPTGNVTSDASVAVTPPAEGTSGSAIKQSAAVPAAQSGTPSSDQVAAKLAQTQTTTAAAPAKANLQAETGASGEAKLVEVAASATGTSTTSTAAPSSSTVEKITTPGDTAADKAPGDHVLLATQAGVIIIDLFEDDAPKHVANFKKLVNEGFYNGLAFYRVIEGFIAQAGDPKGTGSGGPGYTIPAEIKRKHVRGSVVMARDRADPTNASNGSQFYICLKPHSSLDEQGYTVFGQVVQGMDVTDRLEKYSLKDVKNTQGILPNARRTKILEAKVLKATAGNYDEHAVLKTTAGEIVIDLFEAEAPIHAANFQRLVREGFYKNLTFHRVIEGYMAQGGDPQGDGKGGPGYTLTAEIGRKHVRGAVSAARLPDPFNPERRSSGSQFFICFKDLAQLDAGGYSVFGQVIRGMENVDQIPKGPIDREANGVVPLEQRAVIESAVMVAASSGE